MFNWIGSNSSALAVLTNFGTLLVWLIYLHLLLVAYLRQRKSKILINRGGGSKTSAHCLISNMSSEPIYVQSIIATLKTEDRTWEVPVTDWGALNEARRDELRASEATSQGPLGSGEFMDLGTFRQVIDRIVRETGELPDSFDDMAKTFRSLEITVIAAYGPDDLAVGAKRTFALFERGGENDLVPTTVETKQIHSRFERRRIHGLLEQHL